MPVPAYKPATDNVIDMHTFKGKLVEKKPPRYNKDGSIDKRQPNKKAGVSSEVYPLTSEEEIKAMIDVFNNRIDEAPDENKRQIACRNKLLFVIGVNVGLRASDLIKLQFNNLLEEDGSFKEFYVLQPKKTRKTGKFVKLYFNQAVKKAVSNYISEYPIFNIDDYMFKSRVGDGPITERTLWKIIVDAGSEANIKKNLGSHSLRKTWAFTIWHNAEDKNRALVMLQQCLRHSTSIDTMRYIGILDEEKKEMYESIDLGLDYI